MEKKLAIDLFKAFLTLKNPILSSGNERNSKYYRVLSSDGEITCEVALSCEHKLNIISGNKDIVASYNIEVNETGILINLWEKAYQEQNKPKSSDDTCDAFEYLVSRFTGERKLFPKGRAKDFKDDKIYVFDESVLSKIGPAPMPFPKGGHCSDEPECVVKSAKGVVIDKKEFHDKLAEKIKELEKLITNNKEKTPVTIEGLEKLGFKINQEVGAKYCTYKHFTIIAHGGEFNLQTPIGKLNIDYIKEVENLIKNI